MKTYIYIFLFIIPFLFAACRSTKTSQDKDLFTAIKKFEKDPSNTELKNRITELYNNAAKSHLDKIEVYNTLTEADKWGKLLKEYEALRKLYETIGTSAASKLVNAPSYSSEIENAKQSGAEAYYNIGISELDKGDKQSARNAYYAFNTANKFIPGYKDVRQQISLAYQNSIVNVVINRFHLEMIPGGSLVQIYNRDLINNIN